MNMPSHRSGLFGSAGLSVLLHGLAAAAIVTYGFGGASERPDRAPIPIALVIEEPAVAPEVAQPDLPKARTPDPVVGPSPATESVAPIPAARRAQSPPRAKPEIAPVVKTDDTAVTVVETPAANLPDTGNAPATESRDGERQTIAALGPAAAGGVSSGRMPRLLHAPAPDYPPIARRRGQQGRVLLLVAIDGGGVPVEARLKEGSGHATLDEAALKTIRAWRFDASDLEKRLVEVPIVFRLGE